MNDDERRRLELDFIKFISEYGISQLDCFIYGDGGHITDVNFISECRVCGKKFGILKNPVSIYQHFKAKHVDWLKANAWKLGFEDNEEKLEKTLQELKDNTKEGELESH